MPSFTHFLGLTDEQITPLYSLRGLEQISLGAQSPGAPTDRRSSPIYGGGGAENQFESSQVDSPTADVTEFLAGLRFDNRNILDELPISLHR